MPKVHPANLDNHHHSLARDLVVLHGDDSKAILKEQGHIHDQSRARQCQLVH